MTRLSRIDAESDRHGLTQELEDVWPYSRITRVVSCSRISLNPCHLVSPLVFLQGANVPGHRVCFNIYWQRQAGRDTVDRRNIEGSGEMRQEDRDCKSSGCRVDDQFRVLEGIFLQHEGIPHLGKQHSEGTFDRSMRMHPGTADFCSLVDQLQMSPEPFT